MLRCISRECRTYTKFELLWEALINLERDVKHVGGMWIQLLALLQRMDSCRRVHKILQGSVDGRMQRTALVGRLGGHTTDTVSHQEEAWTLLDLSPPSPGLAQRLAHIPSPGWVTEAGEQMALIGQVWVQARSRHPAGWVTGRETLLWGLPWWFRGKESTRQCRGHRFDPWSGKILHATGQLGPWAATAEPARREPVLRKRRPHTAAKTRQRLK